MIHFYSEFDCGRVYDHIHNILAFIKTAGRDNSTTDLYAHF